MNKKITFSSILFSVFITAPSVWASPLLVDWAFNDNGTVFSAADTSTDALPGHFNTDSFDWVTGLGNITLNYDTAGGYSVQAFFDHEIVEGTNTYYNEYGEVHSSPAPGQSWEIDEHEPVNEIEHSDGHGGKTYEEIEDEIGGGATMSLQWMMALQEGSIEIKDKNGDGLP